MTMNRRRTKLRTRGFADRLETEGADNVETAESEDDNNAELHDTKEGTDQPEDVAPVDDPAGHVEPEGTNRGSQFEGNRA